jgi:hypothetical protein
MDWVTGRGRGRDQRPEANPAGADKVRLADEVVPLINDATGASWYEQYMNPVDVALVRLCRLRRAGAGQAGDAVGGDEAVRQALGEADPEAVVWLASRVISYLDEQDYPQTLSPWIED